MRRIDFVFFDAGGGHRAAATALKTVIEEQGRPWDVRLVNLQELFDKIDLIRRVTGVRVQDVYNRLLERGWTRGSAQLLKLLHVGIRLLHPAQVRVLAQYWSTQTPDLVVSLVPNFNRALYHGFAKANPGAPYVTILTDLADYPPHFWLERQDQWAICGTGRAVEQAQAAGLRPERVLRASGMILGPGFYETAMADPAAERARLGLRPDVPTALVLFGGYGSKAMLEIATTLRATTEELQLICICGRNAELAEQLRGMETQFPIHVEGFTNEVPRFMRLADFLIGKPGPGSISEAIAADLPVIVQRSSQTLPQERYNTDWVTENHLGLVVEDFQEIGAAVERLVEPERFARYQQAARRMENRAVFEIPDMLASILEDGRSPSKTGG